MQFLFSHSTELILSNFLKTMLTKIDEIEKQVLDYNFKMSEHSEIIKKMSQMDISTTPNPFIRPKSTSAFHKNTRLDSFKDKHLKIV